MTAPSANLQGRVALVTGASSGIGQATAEKLASAGAFVGVHYNSNQTGAEKILAGIRELGGDGLILKADLADPKQAAEIVDRLVQETGRLDILFNNAGSPIQRTKLEDCPLELWQQIITTNLTSHFVVTRQAIPHLRKSGHGAIINNLSLSVQTGGANGAGAYAIAKGGLQVMTRTLARELAPAVRVNAIMPGVIATPHHEQFTAPERMEQYRNEVPLERIGTAAEVAEAVLYLASDSSSYINGALIDINGGRFLR